MPFCGAFGLFSSSSVCKRQQNHSLTALWNSRIEGSQLYFSTTVVVLLIVETKYFRRSNIKEKGFALSHVLVVVSLMIGKGW